MLIVYTNVLVNSAVLKQFMINLTVCAVNIGVLCWNLAESKSVLKMCISKHCHEVTGFFCPGLKHSV